MFCLKMLSEDSRKGFQKNNLTKFNFIVTFGVFLNSASSVLSFSKTLWNIFQDISPN